MEKTWVGTTDSRGGGGGGVRGKGHGAWIMEYSLIFVQLNLT